ncbi:hypothetical protein MRB53_041992 [Persea americana]|nr:hypothetical protein MRB53_041992 [Persea americana]
MSHDSTDRGQRQQPSVRESSPFVISAARASKLRMMNHESRTAAHALSLTLTRECCQQPLSACSQPADTITDSVPGPDPGITRLSGVLLPPLLPRRCRRRHRHRGPSRITMTTTRTPSLPPRVAASARPALCPR